LVSSGPELEYSIINLFCKIFRRWALKSSLADFCGWTKLNPRELRNNHFSGIRKFLYVHSGARWNIDKIVFIRGILNFTGGSIIWHFKICPPVTIKVGV